MAQGQGHTSRWGAVREVGDVRLHPREADGQQNPDGQRPELSRAAGVHVLYHQTYCNHVRAWVKRYTAIADVQAITYGAARPDDLAAHMYQIFLVRPQYQIV